MGYIVLVHLFAARSRVRALYLDGMNFSAAYTQVAEADEKQRKRKAYKDEKRREMQSEPDFHYEEWEARVRQWRHHLTISKAIKRQEEYDKANQRT